MSVASKDSSKWTHRKVYGSTMNEAEVSTELRLMSGKESVYRKVEEIQDARANSTQSNDLKITERYQNK